MMIVKMDNKSAPSSRERAQRLFEKVFFFLSFGHSMGWKHKNLESK
jgi:hypothetical protein